MKRTSANGVASPLAWREAMQADRMARAEHLRLPSGATILAVRPEPLEWILSGRIPQHLLGAAMEPGPSSRGEPDHVMSHEEILDLAEFARQLVRASVVKPRVGEGPGEIALDDIPVKDRAFIFEWACRALKEEGEDRASSARAAEPRSASAAGRYARALNRKAANPARKEFSSDKLERFRKD